MSVHIVSARIPRAFDFLFRPARYKVAHGGRGSGKSRAYGDALILRCAQQRTRWLCAREYQNSIDDSVHRLLSDSIVRMGLTNYFIVNRKGIYGANGSSISFAGLRTNPTKVKSMEGLDGAWVEEAENISTRSWELLIPTLRKTGSEIWVTYNPGLPTDPTSQLFQFNPPPGAVVREVNWRDNPWFCETELAAEKDWLARVDPDAYAHVWEGKFRTNGDAEILRGRYRIEGFDPDLWKQADRLHLGADFGFAVDPNTLIRSFVLDSVLYIEHEAYGIGVDLLDMPEFYDSVPGAREWPIKCDAARPETISFLRGQGFAASAAEKWDGSVKDGIAYLRGFERIQIHPRCRHVAEEARLYSYKQDPKTGEVLPIVLDKHNHTIDAIRYSLDGYITRGGDMGIWQRLGKPRIDQGPGVGRPRTGLPAAGEVPGVHEEFL
jgi:phage terminase large subunit